MSKLLFGAVALTLGVGGFAAGHFFHGFTGHEPPADDALPLAHVSVPKLELAGAVDAQTLKRPRFEFVDQDGKQRDIAEWDGHVLAVNFWATWCAPCLVEIPHFVEMQERLGSAGLQFVGVALDDSDKVKAFVGEHGMNYPTAHGQENALDLMRAYGNNTGGLPFTAFVARDGRIVMRKAGVLTSEELERIVSALLGES